MSSPEPDHSPPPAIMATPSSSPPTTPTTPDSSTLDDSNLSPSSISTSPSSTPEPSNAAPPKPSPSQIDYRTPSPTELNTISQRLSDLHLSLQLATKITSYITHRTSLFSTILNRQKTRNEATLKKGLIGELRRFWKDGELDVDEFGKMFSCFADGNENRSRAFVMEIARCEGVKECVEFACRQHIIDCEKLIRDTIIEPLTHALAHRTVPQYIHLISATHEIHQQTVNAIRESTVRLKELVELANKRLAAIPEDGEEWDDDYHAFALTKKAAREEFARSLGM
ncbi:hypothetical protein ONS96_005634 [Cadophora gregata f. sp. sojae]|nr:hypothetical protein ONS96_005634 [Cadophora gregata f. sp. sojae]